MGIAEYTSHRLRSRLFAAVAAVLLGAATPVQDAGAERCGTGVSLSQGRAYRVEPTPNYVSAQPGDDTDLTDGVASGAAARRPRTVEWSQRPAVRVTLPLLAEDAACSGSDCAAVAGLRVLAQVDTKANVHCPDSAVFEVSDDGRSFHTVAEWQRSESEACAASGRRAVWIESGCVEARAAFARVTVETETSHISLAEIEVAAGGHRPADAAARGAAASAPEPSAEWRAVTPSPWLRGGGDTPPDPAEEAGSISLLSARGEVGSARIRVSNPYDAALGVAVEVEAPTASSGVALGAPLELRRGIDIPGMAFRDVSDALALLGGKPLPVPPGRTADLWLHLTVPSQAEPGTYIGAVVLRADCAACPAERRVPLQVEVVDLSLAAYPELPAVFFDWSKSIPEGSHHKPGKLADARAATRARFGSNAHRSIRVPALRRAEDGSLGPPAGRTVDAFVGEIRRHDHARMHLLFFGVHQDRHRNFYGAHCFAADGPVREAWDRAYAKWVRAALALVTGPEVGLTPDRFALYPVDEPNSNKRYDDRKKGCGQTNSMEILEAAARVIKRIDPTLRVYANPAQKKRCVPQMGCVMDRLADDGLIDIWMPNRHHYDVNQGLAAFYRERQQQGRPGEQVWIKAAARMTLIDAHPHRDARFTVWQMIDDELQGHGYYNFFFPGRVGEARISVWRPRASTTLTRTMVYPSPAHDPDAPADAPRDEDLIPSRRLTALRQGIEDYRFWLAYRARLASLRERGVDVARYETGLAEAVRRVVNEKHDVEAPDRARAQMARNLRALAALPAASEP